MTDQAVEQATLAPEAPPAPEAPSTPSPVEVERNVMQASLHEMAKKEDASDFIEEIRDQESWRAGDPEANNPTRKQLRAERLQPVLDRLKAEAAEVTQQREPQDDVLQIERARARAEVLVSQHERENPGFVERVKATIEAHGDITQQAAAAIYESPLGAEIVDRICQQPELIAAINNLPPRELDIFVARTEGLLDGMGREPATPKAPAPIEPKRVSSAPKPVTTVSGKSAPPSRDLYSLAASEDASAFIEESRRRERARAR